MERNPYASPAIAPGSGSARRVPIENVPATPEIGLVNVVEQASSPARMWRFAFSRDEAWLYLPDEQSAFAFTHAELAAQATIFNWGRFIAVVLNGLLPDGRAIGFKFEGDAVAVLRRWIHEQRALHVAAALKRRTRFALPLGIISALFSLPILGTGFQPFSLSFGIGLIALAVLGPRYPRPALFIVDALVWFSLVASQIASFVSTESKLSLLFAILGVVFGGQSLRAYGFYR